ncbi:anticodon nuclease [Pseudomonas sp. GW456-12-1-14-TSB6]|uniref:anticodon nuclease n=1 Tax=Pseudomonas sp. GW456-12-1-14-TSB6 TaxID=2751350 RepID=UPI000CD01A29|nr:anticodon nuclease [Pseudomonas sp. GW456-12-1-14-TSB6]POA39006.1 anticodon nuclease [Pseudomonas sp. GW456-12-1-14-TSB6]
MSKTLTEVAQELKDANKKVQLIYAFNGTGKTRLSREFKQRVLERNDDEEASDTPVLTRSKILYYSAFTEDLFYWDNDLALDAEPRLRIQPNSFTNWLLGVLRDLGQDGNIVRYFQHYTSDKLTPHFSEDLSEVTFSLERGNDERSGNLKISKGEESNFIWSIFYTLLDQVISTRNVPEPEDRETREFDQLEYVFIDDPVSSLDENHLIELAVNLAGLIKTSPSDLKFVITTHSPLFYNVLHNELGLSKGGKREGCYLLGRLDDGSFDLGVKYGDSNKSFSYHLHLRQTLEQAIAAGEVQRYHFTLLRNLYEKTASFLGYPQWSGLLPDNKQAYLNRIMQFTSHSTLSNESVTEPTPQEKQTVKLLLDHLLANYGYWQQEEEAPDF